tara:strand:+ start:68 stop:232 length:165 start_codon:yes stop_codon:yes gene_type:complete
MLKIQSYDEWFKENEKLLRIVFAKSGVDKEMDFDFEWECYKKYGMYYSIYGEAS